MSTADEKDEMLKQARVDWDCTGKSSTRFSTSKLYWCVREDLAYWLDVYKIFEMMVQVNVDKMPDRVIDVAKQQLDEELQTWDSYHNKAFIESALQIASDRLLT